MTNRPPFVDVLRQVAGVEGWMTDDQARRLHDRARDLGAGTRIVEIGSFRGRSLIVLASAATEGVEIVSIDPHAGSDRGPQEIAADQARGDDDHSVYVRNLTEAGVRDRVTHVRKMSDDALADVDGEIDLLYIDGAHRFGPARADIVDWGDRVSGGGTMLIHDSFSSIGVTLALLSTTFWSGQWRYIGRSQSMAEFRRERLDARERVIDLARQSAQLPWFVRNVAIKMLLTAKLYPLTRILGHRSRDWPY
ncbi:MAG: class I SAM-dependent methyltransferase [Acidimicrobiales bacterium]